MYEKAFEQWEPFQLKHRLRRHDGEYRWVVIPQRRDLRHLGLEKTYADEMAESGGEPEDA